VEPASTAAAPRLDESDHPLERILAQPSPARAAPAAAPAERVMLVAIDDEGLLTVRDRDDRLLVAEWLETGAAPLALQPGDRLLALRSGPGEPLLVVGRIGRYRAPQAAATVRLEATEMLSLRCGESSLDLRADGKVMLRGKDVLLRASETQRIKAGVVNIN